MQAMTHSVANDPVKLVVTGSVFLNKVVLDCICGTNGNEKWGELGKWLCNR